MATIMLHTKFSESSQLNSPPIELLYFRSTTTPWKIEIYTLTLQMNKFK